MLNAAFFQNGRIQDGLLFLAIWEFIANSQSSAVEINYPSSLWLNFLAQLKQHVFAIVPSFPFSEAKHLLVLLFSQHSTGVTLAPQHQHCLMMEVSLLYCKCFSCSPWDWKHTWSTQQCSLFTPSGSMTFKGWCAELGGKFWHNFPHSSYLVKAPVQ